MVILPPDDTGRGGTFLPYLCARLDVPGTPGQSRRRGNLTHGLGGKFRQPPSPTRRSVSLDFDVLTRPVGQLLSQVGRPLLKDTKFLQGP